MNVKETANIEEAEIFVAVITKDYFSRAECCANIMLAKDKKKPMFLILVGGAEIPPEYIEGVEHIKMVSIPSMKEPLMKAKLVNKSLEEFMAELGHLRPNIGKETMNAEEDLHQRVRDHISRIRSVGYTLKGKEETDKVLRGITVLADAYKETLDCYQQTIPPILGIILSVYVLMPHRTEALLLHLLEFLQTELKKNSTSDRIDDLDKALHTFKGYFN